MKVGGNESATKYFQSHGGSAALASKDPKTKYTSNAATKYKDELKRRANADAAEFPDNVVITDVSTTATEAGTPAAEAEDDFFSSWDKPSIKRPSNPPSRTATPPVGSRTASPFLNPGTNGNGVGRPKSPLAGSEVTKSQPPAAIRSSSTPVVRKSAATGAARKTNVLGAKKTQKLGAKKISGAEAIDFDAAEKRAKEEAERVEKLGYDPEAEQAATASTATKSVPDVSKIAAPTPISPSQSGYGNASHSREKSASEMERLGMGMGRLGFGQIGGSKPAAGAAAPKKMGGFGSVGPIKATQEGKIL